MLRGSAGSSETVSSALVPTWSGEEGAADGDEALSLLTQHPVRML